MKKKRKNKFLFCTIISLCLLLFTHVVLEAVDNTFLDDENMIAISNDLKAGNTEVALEKLDKLIEENPEYENALTLRAYWNILTAQNSEQVMKDIKAISQIQENPAKIYEDMTYLCYDNKKYGQAWNLVDYALPVYPESYNLNVARGLLEMEEGNLETAIVYYEKALEIKPDYAYALIELTDAYIEQKDYEKALAITDKMIQYNPDSHLAYHRRYNIYSDTDRYEQALEAIQKAIEVTENDAANYAYYTALSAWSYMNLDDRAGMNNAAYKAKALGDDFAYNMLDLDYDSTMVVKLESYPFSIGTLYAYHINAENSEREFDFEFAVKVKEKSPEKLSYEWLISRVYEKGEVSMDSTALQHADELLDHFYGKDKEELTERTAVWVSKDVYNELENGEEITLDTGKGKCKFKNMGVEPYRFVSNNVNVEVDVMRVQSARDKVKSDKGNKPEVLLILADASNPLIMDLYVDWNIELKKAFVNKNVSLKEVVQDME